MKKITYLLTILLALGMFASFPQAIAINETCLLTDSWEGFSELKTPNTNSNPINDLYPQGKPEPITDLQVTYNEEEHIIEFSFEEPDNGGSKIRQYVIYEMNDDGKFEPGFIKKETSFQYPKSIEPGEYCFKITAKNKYGESSVRKAEAACVTVPDKSSSSGEEGEEEVRTDIPSPPLNIKARYRSGNIVFSWDEPEHNGGSKISKYHAFVYIEGAGKWLKFIDTSVRTFRDLPVAGEFEAMCFKVYAENLDMEMGIGSEVACFRGRYFDGTFVVDFNESIKTPDEPLEVKSWYMKEDGKYVAYMEWEPPEYDGGVDVFMYRIYMKDNDGEFEKLMFSDYPYFTFNQDREEPSVRFMYDLEAGKTYEFLIKAGNALGEGKASEISSFTVGANGKDPNPDPPDVTVPPHAPKNVKAEYNPSKKYIAVSWDEPYDGESKIKKYKVHYKSLSTENCKEFNNGTIRTSFIIERVAPNDEYIIDVYAINKNGEGFRSEPIKVKCVK